MVTLLISFDLVHDQKGHSKLRVSPDLLYELKVRLTVFGKFDPVNDQKGHGDLRCRHDLLYDTKGHGDLIGRLDLVYIPTRSQGP